MAPEIAFLTATLCSAPAAAAGRARVLRILVLTFPYDLLARRIEIEAQRAGAEVKIGARRGRPRLGAGRRDVRVRIVPAPGAEPWRSCASNAPVVSPDILALILRRPRSGSRCRATGKSEGTHRAQHGPAPTRRFPFRIDASDLDLSALPLQEFAGVTASGTGAPESDLPALSRWRPPAAPSRSARDGAVSGGSRWFLLPAPRSGRVEGSGDGGERHRKRRQGPGARGDIEADMDGNVTCARSSRSRNDLPPPVPARHRWLNENAMIKGMIGPGPERAAT